METKTLKCESLQIVDENGKIRMVLSANSKNCSIVFCEEDSPYMQILVSKNNEANLTVLDREGVTRLSFGMFADGSVGYAIKDPGGITKAFMGYQGKDTKAAIGCEGKLIG